MGDHAESTQSDRDEVTVADSQTPVNRDSIDGLVDFLLSAGAMKNLPRTGWRLAGIKDCESVADHAFRVALLALVLGELVEGVDRDKLLRMALLHELPESLVTDLPRRSVKLLGGDVKWRAERDTWSQLLPPGQVRDEWRALWEEFDAGQTLEARLAKAADKLEMLLQAYEYERVGYRNLDDFWDNTDLSDSEIEPVRAILADLVRRRGQVVTGERSDKRI
jgi:putative hydrolase of HD superfamily